TTQYQVQEVASASYLASYDVPWDLDPACRNQVTVVLSPPQTEPVKPKALACLRTNRDFVGLAMSGGGSRAAVFSAAVLFELHRYGLLQQTDVMSSVSGGSFAAAFYALSCDDPANCPVTVEGPPRFTYRFSVVKLAIVPAKRSCINCSFFCRSSGWVTSGNPSPAIPACCSR
ncbi:MAG: patatin-like phospholipase family protein, partial [Nitrospiraceae bacterium]